MNGTALADPAAPAARRGTGPVQQSLLAWASMLGTDILLHGGILHGHYLSGHPFILPPERAFQLIPLGYLSFLIVAALLVWLAGRLAVTGTAAGTKFGLILGGAIWASTVAGLASITTAPPPLLAGWLIGQTVEVGIAGAVVGAARGGAKSHRLWMLVIAWCVLALAATVVLQNLPS
jgi:energy-converting hydrogenase Eha subunit B